MSFTLKRPPLGEISFICSFSLIWIIWQSFGIEIMRPPWEDEVVYTLPATNWAKGGMLAIPQLEGFLDSEKGWRWHMPLFPFLCGLWQKVFGSEFLIIRLFTLIPAAVCVGILAKFCQWLAGQKSKLWLLFWLTLLGADKTILTNALTGRMEFHALLFTLLSIWTAFKNRGVCGAFFSAFFWGIAVSFHPFAAYFLPTSVWLLWIPLATTSLRHRLEVAFSFCAGLAIPSSFLTAWFLYEPHLTEIQFLTAVRGSGSGGILENGFKLISGMTRNFRFQPFLLLLAIILPGIATARILSKKFDQTKIRSVVAMLLGAFFYSFFLLRGSANHFYYYVPVAILAYLWVAFAMGYYHTNHTGRWKLCLKAMVMLVFLNNFAFATSKTFVVWENRGKLDPHPMHDFLVQISKGGDRVVLPPNLWLFGIQSDWNFRISTLSIVGMDLEMHRQYRSSLLQWNPDLIIIDEGYSPPWRNSFSAEELQAVGYKETGSFNRTFLHRSDYTYAGYRLHAYKKISAVP